MEINVPQMPMSYTTHANDDVIYFIEQCRPGLDFNTVLDEMGMLSQTDASYYFATLVLALEKLHMRYKVVHRGIMPNNIYITRKGTLVLDTHFYMKKLDKAKFYTLYEINDYVAPE